MFRRSLRLRIVLAVSLCVAFVPVLPALAAPGTAGHDHPAHAGHPPAPDPVPADDAGVPTYKHDYCNDHCCLACTMHVVGTAAFVADRPDGRSLQVAAVRHYHPYRLITPPERPPRYLS